MLRDESCVGAEPNLEDEGQVAPVTEAQGPDKKKPDPYVPQAVAAGVASSEAERRGTSYFYLSHSDSLSPF